MKKPGIAAWLWKSVIVQTGIACQSLLPTKDVTIKCKALR
jgi:hypothetical protein